MRVAVEGCAHGELEIIYKTIEEIEKADGAKIDLLICCGDFQSTRNLCDLNCMAVPDKFKDICTFYKYYSGEKVAPILTIFIGGNHEASNFLQELPYGGWVAPNIYYLGYAGVVRIGGLRIAGISGIYKGQDYTQGHHEFPPYTPSTIRSVYHIRSLEVFRLKQLSGHIDIFLSHDWPRGITKYGDEQSLLKKKPFFGADIQNNALGSPPCMDLLEQHYPRYWFSAHLHCKFAALVQDADGKRMTKFLALDKCLPQRKFLQILEIEHDVGAKLKLHYDLEWLTVLYLTNHLLSVKKGTHYMPGKGGAGRWIFTPSQREMDMILRKFNDNLQVPLNFKQTVAAFNPDSPDSYYVEPGKFSTNRQTIEFCDKLGIDDPATLLQIMLGGKAKGESKILATADENDSCLESTLDCRSLSNSSVSGETSTDLTPTKSDNEYHQDRTSSRTSQSNVNESNVCESSSVTWLLAQSSDAPDCATPPMETQPLLKKFKRRNHSAYADTG